MPILARCPDAGCGQAVRAKDEWAGKKVRCPRCQGIIAIPAAPAPARADSPPAKEKPQPTPAPAPARTKPQPEADDFAIDEPPPAKKTKPAPRDEDDYDDRPATKTKKGGKKKRAPEEDLPDTLWEDSDLLKHDILMSKVAFSIWGSGYTLSNPETEEEVGLAKEKLPLWKGALRPVNLGPIRFRDWMATVIEVRESADGPVLFTVRKRANPWPWQLTSTIEVLDFRKELIGSFKTKLFSYSGGFWLHDADNERIAELKGKLSGKNARLEFLSVDGDELGLITAEPKKGLGKFFGGAPGLIVTLNDEVKDNLKTKVLLLAATLAMGLTGVGKKLGASTLLSGGDEEGEEEEEEEAGEEE